MDKNKRCGRCKVKKRDTHCAQQTLRFLNGTITSEEADEHHHGPNGYQYVHTCKQRNNRKLTKKI